MSRLDQIAYEIEQLFIEGLSPRMISETLGVPVSMVHDWLASNSLDDEDGCGPDLIEDELSPYSTVNS